MHAISKEEAIECAERMIQAGSAYTRREFQIGYFEGLVGGWHQCGLITESEMLALRKRMQATRPAWWNLAAHLGI